MEEVKEVISNLECFIAQSNQFSDMAISLSIEIEEQEILTLYQVLKELVLG